MNGQLPQWEEAFVDARDRFLHVIHALADKYPAENLLLITHGKNEYMNEVASKLARWGLKFEK